MFDLVPQCKTVGHKWIAFKLAGCPSWQWHRRHHIQNQRQTYFRDTLLRRSTKAHYHNRDHPGEPVPEENFWTLWCKGKINRDRHTHHPPGRHSIRTNQYPYPPSPHFWQAVCPSGYPTNSVKVL